MNCRVVSVCPPCQGLRASAEQWGPQCRQSAARQRTAPEQGACHALAAPARMQAGALERCLPNTSKHAVTRDADLHMKGLRRALACLQQPTSASTDLCQGSPTCGKSTKGLPSKSPCLGSSPLWHERYGMMTPGDALN